MNSSSLACVRVHSSGVIVAGYWARRNVSEAINAALGEYSHYCVVYIHVYMYMYMHVYTMYSVYDVRT